MTTRQIEELEDAIQPRVINDFSITVATVNGSGSQTSNMTIFRCSVQDGYPGIREKLVSLEYPGIADLVYHPGQQRWFPGPPGGAGNRHCNESSHIHKRPGECLSPVGLSIIQMT